MNRLKWVNRVFIAFAVGALAALATAAVVGTNTKRPGGGQSMGDAYTIALSSVLVFTIVATVTFLVMALLGRKP
jgi:hypothetical protein